MLLRIESQPGVTQVFIASEEISDLATIAITEVGSKYVELGRNVDQPLVCGVARGAVSGQVSGKPLTAVVLGMVSGVICATAVNAGDRITCASAGRITPINTITPAGSLGGGGLVSGLQAASGIISGYTTLTSGTFTGTAFNTARVLGKALASGGVGSGIPILVTLGG